MSFVILGVGNLLLADDGVGVHAARLLAADPPAGAEVCEVGTAVFEAWSVLERADRLIVIDAVDAGQPPGTVVQFELNVEEEGSETPASLHAFDLTALLRLLPPERRPSTTVIGVQPAVLELGLDLSPVVAGQLSALLKAVRCFAAGLSAPPGHASHLPSARGCLRPTGSSSPAPSRGTASP